MAPSRRRTRPTTPVRDDPNRPARLMISALSGLPPPRRRVDLRQRHHAQRLQHRSRRPVDDRIYSRQTRRSRLATSFSQVGPSRAGPAGQQHGHRDLVIRRDGHGELLPHCSSRRGRSGGRDQRGEQHAMDADRGQPPDLTVAALYGASARRGRPAGGGDRHHAEPGGRGARRRLGHPVLPGEDSVLAAGDPIIGERAIPQLAPGAKQCRHHDAHDPALDDGWRLFHRAKADGPGALLEKTRGQQHPCRRHRHRPRPGRDGHVGAGDRRRRLSPHRDGDGDEQASGAAASSTLRFYLSTNTTFGAGDVLLGSRLVPSLLPASTVPARPR